MVKYIQKSQWWQQLVPPQVSEVNFHLSSCLGTAFGTAKRVRPAGRFVSVSPRCKAAPWRDVQQMNASSEVVPSSPASQLLSLWSSFFLAILAAAAVDVCYISRPKVGFLKDIFKAKIEGIEGRKVVWCSCLVFEHMRVNVGKWADRMWNPPNTPVDAVLLTYLTSQLPQHSFFVALKSPLLLSIKKILLGVRPFEGEQGSDDFCYNDHYRVLLPYLVYWRYIAYPVVGPGAGNGGWGSIHIPQRKWNPEGCTNWLSQLHLIDEVKSMH